MGSNQEIGRIQEWIATWYGTSVDNCLISWEDIRNICRGPMREVLVDFVVPRFRTEAQIKVIRSNTFLTDLRGSDDDLNGPVNKTNYDDEIKQLRLKLEETLDEKVEIVKGSLNGVTKLEESRTHLAKDVMDNLAQYEKLDFRLQLIKRRVLSNTTLLEDMRNIKPQLTASENSESLSGIELSRAGVVSPRILQLKMLHSKASDLFNLYFLSYPYNSESSVEMRTLSSSISDQTDELTKSGLKRNAVEKWTRKDQEFCMNQIIKVEEKFSNVMRPIEELAGEAESLYVKLMEVHVDQFFGNRKLSHALHEATVLKNKKIKDVVLNDDSVVPADFFSFIQREEQQKKLTRCRELAKQFKSLNNFLNNHQDCDMLAVMCGENFDSAEYNSDHQGSVNEDRRASWGLMDGSLKYLKRETLEELTCALLKSYSEGRNKLQSTVSHCKTLVMEKFANMPNMLMGDNSGNRSKFMNVKCERECVGFDTAHFKLPNVLLKPDLLAPPSTVLTSNDHSQMDFLKEIFSLQNELRESRSQCETLFRDRTSSSSY